MLAFKKIPYQYETVKLLNGEQHFEDYASINPMHQVPSIKVVLDDGQTHFLTQSLAIIRYLEENYPENPIYPQDPISRAKSIAIAETISSGVQPLQNLETLLNYGEPLGLGQLSAEDRKKVANYWLSKKMGNVEKLVKSTAGKYCVGDSLTIADIALVPQMFNAKRFELDTTNFPILREIDARLQKLECFKLSHPMACPDGPKS